MQEGSLTKEELRARRSALGIRQSELAEMVGVSANYISQFELGNREISGRLRLSIVRVLEELESRKSKSSTASISVRDIHGDGNAVGHNANAVAPVPVQDAARLLAIIESQQATIAALVEKLGK